MIITIILTMPPYSLSIRRKIVPHHLLAPKQIKSPRGRDWNVAYSLLVIKVLIGSVQQLLFQSRKRYSCSERLWCWATRSQKLFLLIAGYYMYIETSTGLVGNKAVLVSPRYQQAYSTAKLSFWYHMYGRTIGRLSVYLNDGINRTRMWTLYGLYSCETRDRT